MKPKTIWLRGNYGWTVNMFIATGADCNLCFRRKAIFLRRCLHRSYNQHLCGSVSSQKNDCFTAAWFHSRPS